MTLSLPPVALLTAFRSSDVYVGVRKGLILSSVLDAQGVGISHKTAPQASLKAASTLEPAWELLPEKTVFFTGVDPGGDSGEFALSWPTRESFLSDPTMSVFLMRYRQTPSDVEVNLQPILPLPEATLGEGVVILC